MPKGRQLQWSTIMIQFLHWSIPSAHFLLPCKCSGLYPLPHFQPLPSFPSFAVWKSGIFTHMSNVRIENGRIVCGRTGSWTAGPSYQVTYHTYPASRRQLSYTKCWACSRLNNMRNAACLFSIMSYSREERYQALPILPYGKQQKVGRGLGMRLLYTLDGH